MNPHPVGWGLAPDEVLRGKAPRPAAPFLCVLLVCVALAGCSAQQELPLLEDAGIGNCGGFGEVAASSSAKGSMPTVPLHERLDGSLLSLVESYEDGGAKAALAYAKSSGLDFGERRVSVRVLAASEQDADFLKRRIGEIGGKVESSFENSVFASMPVDVLRAFAASEAVWRVEAQRSLFSPPSPAEPVAENPQDAKEDEE